MQNQHDRMPRYCFLHIGKTAGTAIRAVIAQHNEAHPRSRLEVFTHETTLPRLLSVHPEISVTFFIRDPVERFISGFNSRLRFGRPRYNVPWTEDEAVAFARFPTPNALGEALSSEHADWSAASAAMTSIYHARLDFVHYLHSVDFLEAAKERIAFIGETRSFDTDLNLFKRRLGINAAIKAPNDPVGAHRNPVEFDRSLSTRANANLRRWYVDDYQIYDWCTTYRLRLLDRIVNEQHFDKT